MKYEEVIDLLGRKGKDKITGRTGAISSICFDLYGCIQVTMTPTSVDNKEDVKIIGWLDINRIKILKGKKVMELVSFESNYASLEEVHGAASKPMPS